MIEPRGRLRPAWLAASVAVALAAWWVAFGSIPDEPASPWGPAARLVTATQARPWLLWLLWLLLLLLPTAAGVAWLGTRSLARASSGRPATSARRLALAVPLVAVSLLPAVPGLVHWTLYSLFGCVAVVATAFALEGWAPTSPRPGPAPASEGTPRGTSTFRWWVAGAVVWHLVATIGLCFVLFGGVPHVQDSVAQLFQAKVFLTGTPAAPAPPVARAFEYSHLVTHAGRWFSIYPPGHALLLAAALAVGLPQLVNPLAGAAALVGMALLARDLRGEAAARWVLALALVSPFWLLMHAGFMSHATTHAALVWGVVWWRRSAARRSPWAGLGAGALFGLAFLLRPYPAVLVGLALVAAALLQRRGPSLVACTWTALGALAGVGTALGYNALTTGDPLTFGYVARFGAGHLPGFHAAPWGPPHTPALGLVHVLADLDGLNRYLLAWPLPFTVLLGAGAVAGWRVREAWTVTVPAALLAGHFVYWYADFCFGPRMVFESFFALAILGAAALEALHTRLGRRLPVVLAVALLGSLPLWAHLLRVFGDSYWGVDDEESRAVAAVVPPDAVVFVTGDYGGYVWRNDPRLEAGPVYVRLRGPASNRAVLESFPHRTPWVQRGEELVPFEGARGR